MWRKKTILDGKELFEDTPTLFQDNLSDTDTDLLFAMLLARCPASLLAQADMLVMGDEGIPTLLCDLTEEAFFSLPEGCWIVSASGPDKYRPFWCGQVFGMNHRLDQWKEIIRCKAAGKKAMLFCTFDAVFDYVCESEYHWSLMFSTRNQQR